MNSLSGKILENATVELYIFSQSCDLFKNSWSLVTQVYAMLECGIPLITRFFGNATKANQAIFFKFSRFTDFLFQVRQPTVHFILT